MSVKIRLQRHGRRKRPFYHIVVADARSPRDGRFIEKLGTYNPMTVPATIDLDRERAYDWLMKGAQPTDTARAILRFKGVLYKKHLARGVQKGALTQEEADLKWNAFIQEKEEKIRKRFEETLAKKLEFQKQVSGIPPVVVREEEPVEEAESAESEHTEEPAVEIQDQVEEAAVEQKESEEKPEDTPTTPESAEEAPAEEETKEA